MLKRMMLSAVVAVAAVVAEAQTAHPSNATCQPDAGPTHGFCRVVDGGDIDLTRCWPTVEECSWTGWPQDR